MNISSRKQVLTASVLGAFALSLLTSVPAFADEAPPPREAPAAQTSHTTESSTAPSAAAGLAAGPSSAGEPIQGAEALVINESGTASPVAAEQAALPALFSDPKWCPAGVAPGGAGCSIGYLDLASLVAAVGGGFSPASNGVIWIENLLPDASATDITFDGTLSPAWTTWSAFALTLNGGWNGAPGSTALNQFVPSQFSKALSITGWNNNVTLNNLRFNGALSGTFALDIATTKNILLSNVAVLDNTSGGGARLSNKQPADLGTYTGTVTVNGSTFSGNSGDGLRIASDAAVIGNTMHAIDNGAAGMLVENSTALTAKPVTLTGFNTFNFNVLSGLEIRSQGAITLSNVTALYSGNDGAMLSTNYAFASKVTLKGSNNFSNNGKHGLYIESTGSILLNGVTASGNGTAVPSGMGAWLQIQAAVTLAGTNTFSDNAGAGLLISADGPVSVSNLTANGNGWGVACWSSCGGAGIYGTSTVLLTGFGRFSGNYKDGLSLWVFTPSAVILNHLYASDNGGRGVVVGHTDYGGANVTVLGAGIFTNNGLTGLWIKARGTVTLNNITASNNGTAMDGDGAGVLVDNTLAPTPKPVLLNGTNRFEGNWTSGLEVYSFGAITTSNVTARFNDLRGVLLDACDNSATCTGYSPQLVTMNGTNTISRNPGDGLEIRSLGAIKVNNLTAEFNSGFGVSLDNQWTSSTGALTITGCGNISDNGAFGLVASSKGAITMANLTVDRNYDYGALLENRANPLAPANVTLTGLNSFSDNGDNADLVDTYVPTGLQIQTYGAVVLNNISADRNGDLGDTTPQGAGLLVSNYESSVSTLPRPVTVLGINSFNGNADNGLSIDSMGVITVSRVTASGNGELGAYLTNQTARLNAAINLVGYGIFNDNQDVGLSVESNGGITTNNLTANGNDVAGASLFSQSTTAAPVFVTMLGVNTFNGTTAPDFLDGQGLMVYSDGQITLNNITANDNARNGADINNTLYAIPGAPRGITLSGTNAFVNNARWGIELSSSGAISMTRVIADSHLGLAFGIEGLGVVATAVGNITLTCGSMNLNEEEGYALGSSAGTITLKGVFSTSGGSVSSPFPVIRFLTCPLP